MTDELAENVMLRYKYALAVVFRNVIGRNWGWFSIEDQRMHLQTIESGARSGPEEIKVWLEAKGKRILEPATKNITGVNYKKLCAKIQAERTVIEDHWTTFMFYNQWLTAQLTGHIIRLTAYPGTHNSYTRKIDLRKKFPGAYTDNQYSWDRRTVYMDLDPDHCAIAVGVKKKMDDRNHIYIPDVLFIA